IVRSTAADASPGPSDCSANRVGNRRAMLHSGSQKNRHSRAPAFLRNKSGGKKFRLSAPRHKKFLRNWNRDLPARDTSFQVEEEDRVLSYAFDGEGVTTMTDAASMHKCSLGIFQQFFNNRFRFGAICDFRVNQVEICVVGAKHASVSKIRRIIFGWAIAFARFGVDEDRPTFGIRPPCWNCGVWEKNYLLA